jgi:hypothetical protein
METPETIARKYEAREAQRTTRGRKKQADIEEPTVPNPKIRCILDPSRRMKTYKDTQAHSSWLTATDLDLLEVRRVLECEELRGYAFPEPRKENAVRIYDWVSIAAPLLLILQLSSPNLGLCDLLLPPRERVDRRVRDLGSPLSPTPQVRVQRR